MNERILELFYTAKFEPDRVDGNLYYPYIALQCHGEPFRYSITEEGVKKFAELIIQECGIALSPMLRDMISRGEAYQLIKDHFQIQND